MTPPTGRVVLVNGFEAWVDVPAGNVAAVDAALRARRDLSARARPPRRLRARAVAALDVSRCPTARRSCTSASSTRRRRGRADVAAHGGRRRARAARAAAAVGSRLSRADARERRVRFHARARAAATSPGGRTPALPAIAALVQRRLRARSPTWYRNFLYARGSGARPRLHRGPGRARHLHLRPRARRRRARAARRRRHRRRRSSAGRARSARLEASAPQRRCPARSAPPMPTSCAARAGTRSSPAIRGSPTGDATRSSRCAAWCSRAAASTSPRSILDGTGPATVSRGHAAQPLSRCAARRRSTTRSMPRCGSSSPRTNSWRPRRRPRSARTPAARDRRDPRRLRARHALRHPHGRRRAARLRRARRAAHVDGREGRRPRHHAAHRQAGGSAGAVDQRAAAGRPRTRDGRARASAPFARASGMPARGCLYDVVDADHVAGRVDASVRPNQIFAVGGLPFARGRWRRARAASSTTVERELVTPLGPAHARARRSRVLRALRRRRRAARRRLSPGHRVAVAHGRRSSTRGCACTATTRVDAREARARFVAPLEAQLASRGLGHCPRSPTAIAPHTPRGCPFQAWSLGELLRMRARDDGR